MFESKCKKKHERVLNLYYRGDKHKEMDAACRDCSKFGPRHPKVKNCSKCGNPLEDTKENFKVFFTYRDYGFGSDRYCKKCRKKSNALRVNLKGKRRKSGSIMVNIDGVEMSLSEWAMVYNIRIGTVCQRINAYGKDPIEAITTPVKRKRKGG